MTTSLSPIVLLDANIWFAERMMLSSVGAATLYALTESGKKIGLHEITEREVTDLMSNHAEASVIQIGKSVRFLRQITGDKIHIHVPTQTAISEAVSNRWKNLSGIVEHLPLTLDDTRKALNRIFIGAPPCGQNNEQFRDSCLWECALNLGKHREVHLVSGDGDFYEGRKLANGLSKILQEELTSHNSNVQIHKNLNDFLEATKTASLKIDEAPIRVAITNAVIAKAAEIIGDNKSNYEIDRIGDLRITGYATPKPSEVAISFTMAFDMSRIDLKDDKETKVNVELSVVGGCSYDPNTKNISNVEISQRHMRLNEGGYWTGSTTFHTDFFKKTFRDV